MELSTLVNNKTPVTITDDREYRTSAADADRFQPLVFEKRFSSCNGACRIEDPFRQHDLDFDSEVERWRRKFAKPGAKFMTT